MRLLNTDSDLEMNPPESLSQLGRKRRVRSYVVTVLLILGASLLGYSRRLHEAVRSHMQEFFDFAVMPCDLVSGHHIKSRHSGRCLDWGDVIIQSRNCDISSSEQMWVYNSSQHIHIPDGRCLDDGGSEVHIWPCAIFGDIADNQHWKYNPNTGQIAHVASVQLCLEESPTNTSVYMRPCDAFNPDQQWNLRSVATSPPTPIAVGQIQHRHGMCLDAGGTIHMWSCDTSNKNQDWTYDPYTRQIRSFNGGCLDAGNIDALRRCDAKDPNQQWRLHTHTGHLEMINGNCLDAQEPNKTGTAVFLQACDDEDTDQEWNLQGLTEPSPTHSAMPLVKTVIAILSCLALCAALFLLVAVFWKRAVAKVNPTPPPITTRFDSETRDDATEVEESVISDPEELSQKLLKVPSVVIQWEKSSNPELHPEPSSEPTNQPSVSDRSEGTSDSATPMLNRCKTTGCGKPTWNGQPEGYCYERGPYGRSGLL